MVKTKVHGTIKGVVQGIGYRFFAQREAVKLGLTGWVKNISTGEVEFEAEGDDASVKSFIDSLKNGHPWAKVEDILTKNLPSAGAESDFRIKY